MIKAVYFDGDQTLWEFQALKRRALPATLWIIEAAGLDVALALAAEGSKACNA